MPKIIFYKKPDESFAIQSFGPEFDNMPPKEFEAFYSQRFVGSPTYVFFNCGAETGTDHKNGCCDFPAFDHLDKLYVEDGKLKCDSDWSKVLIPPGDIARKHRARLKIKIEAELQRDKPDAIQLIRWQAELENIKKSARPGQIPSPHLYKIALANLDEKVKSGKPDKPLIRQKLQEKLKNI